MSILFKMILQTDSIIEKYIKITIIAYLLKEMFDVKQWSIKFYVPTFKNEIIFWIDSKKEITE